MRPDQEIGDLAVEIVRLDDVRCWECSQHIDHATANTSNGYLVSVRVEPTQWERINFAALDRLDVEAVLAQFELRRNLTSDGRFGAITPL